MKKIINWIIRKPYYILNDKVKETNWFQNQLADPSQFPTEEWYRCKDERNFDMVNIGSSNAYFAFNYKYTHLKGFNWAGKPQTNETNFKLLKYFYSILKRDGYVIISLCPFSGLKVPRTTLTEELRFYSILKNPLFFTYKDEVYERMENPLKRNPIKALKRLIKDVPKAQKTDQRQLKSEEEFEKNAKWWLKMWKEEFNIVDLEASVPEHLKAGMESRQELLKEIIQFCQNRSLRPILLFPPIHSTLSKYFTPIFFKNYLEPLILIGQECGIQYYDLSNSEEYDSSHFYNAFLLNEKGSQKFMKELESRLER